MKFRKKPIVVEAEQYCGPETIYIEAEKPVLPSGVEWSFCGGQDFRLWPAITTLEGKMIVSPNDWVITGVKGEVYPCKPDIFEATYEAAE
jgi:hypothetical protein